MSNLKSIIKQISTTDRKLLRKMFFRSFTIFAPFSFAKHGASGFCYALMPFINHYYTKLQDKKDALTRHIVWFNTMQNVSTFVMGLAASMEKENSVKADFDAQSINAVKSSLMGPLAGIGDSLFWDVLRVVAAGVALSLAQEGSFLAPIVFLLVYNIPSIACRYFLGLIGFSLGSKYIEELYASGLINILTKAASVLGLIMVGGMTSNIVTFNSVLTISSGENSSLSLQSILDQIFVGIIPLTTTLLCFYLMNNKKVSFNFIIIGIVGISIILAMLGIV